MNVTRNIFSDTPPVAAPFREDVPITLGDVQGIRLTTAKRKECRSIPFINITRLDYENIENFALRCSAGTIKDRNDKKLENAKFQVRTLEWDDRLGTLLSLSCFKQFRGALHSS